MKEEIVNIEDLVKDDLNFNKGTDKGKRMLVQSFSKYGAARSVLIDKNDRLISGNKASEAAKDTGITKVRVIETTGDEIIAVRRVDMDLDSLEGRELALLDNITGKENRSLDYNAIKAAADSVKLDAEAWGIKDLDKILEKEEQEKAKLKIVYSRQEAMSMTRTPVVFRGYKLDVTQEEFDSLTEAVEEYFTENGVVVGFIAELLDI